MSLLQREWILFLWRSVSVCPCEASFERRSYWYGHTKNVFFIVSHVFDLKQIPSFACFPLVAAQHNLL